jgi:hypothetical protein
MASLTSIAHFHLLLANAFDSGLFVQRTMIGVTSAQPTAM